MLSSAPFDLAHPPTARGTARASFAPRPCEGSRYVDARAARVPKRLRAALIVRLCSHSPRETAVYRQSCWPSRQRMPEARPTASEPGAAEPTQRPAPGRAQMLRMLIRSDRCGKYNVATKILSFCTARWACERAVLITRCIRRGRAKRGVRRDRGRRSVEAGPRNRGARCAHSGCSERRGDPAGGAS